MREIDVLPDMSPGELTFGTIPKCKWQRRLKDVLGEIITPHLAAEMLETMFWIRSFENIIIEMRDGKLKPKEDFQFVGATHLSIGQEAVAVGAIAAIRPDDYITSTHRGHGHAIAKGAFALRRMSTEELKQWLGRDVDSPREELVEMALEEHLYRTVAELFGKEDGYCRGRGGGMHIADFRVGHLGANAIVGGSCGIAVGAAMAAWKLGTDRVVLCMIGDGATQNGIFHEAANFACMAQFKRGLPVVFVVENNQYAMTGQHYGEVTGLDYLARRGAAYNLQMMHAEVVNGMDVLAVYDAVSRAVELARNGNGPVLLDCECYRYYGHSLSDQRTKYRTAEEEEAWRRLDPIDNFIAQVIEAGLMTESEVERMRQRCDEQIRQAAIKAAHAPYPDPATIYEGLFSNTMCEEVPEKYRHVSIIRRPRKFQRDSEGKIMYRHAVCEALVEEMMRDSRVIVYGEDVADYGGAFMVTAGLIETFGRDRVFNTPISEAAIVGTAIGAAMVGLRPVVEIMYIDFILLAMDQVGNQAAKMKYMSGGQPKIPLVIRTTIGGGRGYAGQHSQSLEAVVTHFPGLKVVAPATAYDAKGLLKTAIRDDDPVIFIEHQMLYTSKDIVPEDEYLIPLGVARIHREGSDLTICAWSKMVEVALEAAKMLEEQYGVNAEVVDPRTLIPCDYETIASSVSKTGKLLLVCQAPETGCFAEHIAYQVQRRCFRSLKAPIRIVAAHNVPPPMSPTLESENIPSPQRVVKNALELMKEG